MASALERLVLNELDLNDDSAFVLEALDFKPAEARPQFAGNADADGEELVEEPHYTNAYFEAQVRVAHRNDTDTALAAIGELIDRLQSCARADGGVPVEWTPNNSTRTYTWYAIVGEIAEMPITTSGDLAGWFLESPVVKIKLTCRPFGYTDERVVLEATESSTPLQVAFIGEIAGDVPAEGRMVLTDKSSQQRRYAEWGADVVEDKTVPALERKATTFTTSGFAGSKTTLSGSVSSEVVKASLFGLPAVICSSGTLSHVGSYRLKLRCQGSVSGMLIRASYQVGDGPLTTLQWIELSQAGKWLELDLGEAFLEAAERGEQVSKILFEGQAAEGGTVYLDLLQLPPTRRYAVAAGPADAETPSVYAGYDGFNQIAGALAGKTAEIGGAWAGAGDADDFTVNTSGKRAQRTAVSDASGTPRYETLGSSKYTNVVASIEVSSTNPKAELSSNAIMGVLLRFVDTNNWAGLVLANAGVGGSGGGGGGGYNLWYCYFEKKVAGVRSLFVGPSGFSAALGPNNGYLPVTSGAFGVQLAYTKLEAMILSDGTFRVGARGETYLTGNDSVFATGGALAEGKVGIYDEKTSAGAETRFYDNFTAFVPTIGIVCNPGKALQATSQGAELESTAGTYWSPVPEYRGAGFYLEPAGSADLINRLAVKMRRSDIRLEADASTSDKQTLEVLASERFLIPR